MNAKNRRRFAVSLALLFAVTGIAPRGALGDEPKGDAKSVDVVVHHLIARKVKDEDKPKIPNEVAKYSKELLGTPYNSFTWEGSKPLTVEVDKPVATEIPKKLGTLQFMRHKDGSIKAEIAREGVKNKIVFTLQRLPVFYVVKEIKLPDGGVYLVILEKQGK
ncbi:MAG: hypothetical protein ACKVX7_19360 [Planctomycetota bacterium]